MPNAQLTAVSGATGIISVTPYDDLRKKHGSEWDRNKYAAAHVLFLSDEDDKAFLDSIFQN